MFLWRIFVSASEIHSVPVMYGSYFHVLFSIMQKAYILQRADLCIIVWIIYSCLLWSIELKQTWSFTLHMCIQVKDIMFCCSLFFYFCSKILLSYILCPLAIVTVCVSVRLSFNDSLIVVLGLASHSTRFDSSSFYCVNSFTYFRLLRLVVEYSCSVIITCSAIYEWI